MNHRKLRSLIVAAVLLLGPASFVEALDFPATGQVTAFPAEKKDGIPGAVAVPDDGTVRAGAPLSYTDNGDGTITDNNTGLMWEKKSDDGGLHDKDRGYPWSSNGSYDTVWDWLDDINAEGGTGFAGYDDWRLPNAKELHSLSNFENPPLALMERAFNNHCVPGATVLTGSCTSEFFHWSSTTWARSTGMAWGMGFPNNTLTVTDKVGGHRVRAVRGGGSGPGAFPATGQITSYRADKNDGIPGPVAVPDDGTIRAGAPLSFTDNGDLHDKDNIYWWSGNGADETVWDWLEDISATFGGSKGWRIPNARELLSIMDFQSVWAVPAAFNANCVPGATVLTGSCTFRGSYWTSTSHVGSNGSAWLVDDYGSVSWDFKGSTARARAVRGGTP